METISSFRDEEHSTFKIIVVAVVIITLLATVLAIVAYAVLLDSAESKKVKENGGALIAHLCYRETTTAKTAPTRKINVYCKDKDCLEEAKNALFSKPPLGDKIDDKVKECDDFFAHACSDKFTKPANFDINQMPFLFQSLHFIITKMIAYIQGGTCESRCLESGVSTDPEPCGFARPRLAVRGFPVSGEKGILVVEPSPGTGCCCCRITKYRHAKARTDIDTEPPSTPHQNLHKDVVFDHVLDRPIIYRGGTSTSAFETINEQPNGLMASGQGAYGHRHGTTILQNYVLEKLPVIHIPTTPHQNLLKDVVFDHVLDRPIIYRGGTSTSAFETIKEQPNGLMASGQAFMHMLGTAANPPYSSAAGPMPPYPTSASGPMGWSPYSTPLPSTTNTPAATSVAPTPAYPPYPTGSTASYPLYPTPGSGSGYPYPPASTASPVTQPATVGLPPNTGTITQEHIRASLLTAVEDKVKGRLKEVLSVAQAEMDVLKKTHDELNAGKTRLEDMINRMDREQAELESNLQTLRERNEEMKELVRKMESQGAVDVDEAVVTTAPLYKQLVNAFAEENATEDAIYYLGEALRKGVIDLDVFLKHVRELSRKQFMLRALMQKCREKAALP
ncbi:tumor susceptibility gene 101 protein isoform X2 [Ixodes scapularis]